MDQFDFDDWALLYKTNPGEFERKRKELLSAVIASAPVESRAILRVIQQECDILHETLDPMHATVEMSKMMAVKVSQLVPHLSSLQDIINDLGNS